MSWAADYIIDTDCYNDTAVLEPIDLDTLDYINKQEKTMNIFEELEYKEFTEGKQVKAIAKKIKEAKDVAERFYTVAQRVSQLAMEIESDTEMLNIYAEDKEIQALNELTEILTAKLDVFEDKKVVAGVEELAGIFGITKKATKIDKKDIAKSLGL